LPHNTLESSGIVAAIVGQRSCNPASSSSLARKEYLEKKGGAEAKMGKGKDKSVPSLFVYSYKTRAALSASLCLFARI